MRKNFAMQKLYYSISEVSKITDLEQYVLRYWETEFEQLKPAKNLAGNRIYTNKDIKLILLIKKLLRDEKYTIEGAKKILKSYLQKEDKKVGTPLARENETSSKESSRGELKLFKSEDENKKESKDEKLKNDLKELRNFLNNLLNELE
ncbi:MAG: MerR family transcriptional regulator [Ignavibacteria bacterium]|nr:MerR family transcriptional regulator [Ignavibacteria bacterium]